MLLKFRYICHHGGCDLGCDETSTVMKRLANKIAMKLEKPLSEVTCFKSQNGACYTQSHKYICICNRSAHGSWGRLPLSVYE